MVLQSYEANSMLDTCLKEAKPHTSRKLSGRPRNLGEFERDLLFDAIQANPGIKYNELLDLVDNKISRETLRLLLKDLGLRKWRKIKRPQLTERDARLRLAWAQIYRDIE